MPSPLYPTASSLREIARPESKDSESSQNGVRQRGRKGRRRKETLPNHYRRIRNASKGWFDIRRDKHTVKNMNQNYMGSWSDWDALETASKTFSDTIILHWTFGIIDIIQNRPKQYQKHTCGLCVVQKSANTASKRRFNFSKDVKSEMSQWELEVQHTF